MPTSTRQKKDYKLNETSAAQQQRQPIMLSTPKGLLKLKAFLILPDPFVRGQYLDLTYSELMVMLYVFHRTLGYRDPNNGGRKTADAISHSQFLKGITTLEGKQLDRGAGVSERSLNRALDGLEEKGFIKRHYRTDRYGRQLTTIYELDLERAGASWVQEDDTDEENVTNPLSDYLINPRMSKTGARAYTRRAAGVNSNTTINKTAKTEAHFEVAQSASSDGAVEQAPTRSEGTVKAEASAVVTTAVAAPVSNDKGSHWHQEEGQAVSVSYQEPTPVEAAAGLTDNTYVNQDEQEVANRQAVTVGNLAKLRGYPLQNCGGIPCKTAGVSPAKLRGTTESFYKKESYKKDNKTQLLCDASVGKLVSTTYQDANNSSQEQSELCVSFTGKNFSGLTDNSDQVSFMSSYLTKQPITVYKPQKASNHITTPQPAHNASDVARNQPLATNFESVRPSKTGEISPTEQEQKAVLAEEFCQAGVAYLEAYHLADVAYENGHRAGSYVGECLRYIQRQSWVRNRPGLLVHLVRKNWQPTTHEQKQHGSGLLANNHALASKWAHLNNRASVHYEQAQPDDSTSPADINSECEAQSWAAGAGGQSGATHGLVESEPFEITPSPEQCREAWLIVCQTAVTEWGVAPELLVGSWLMPATELSRNPYLLLHLSEPTKLVALRYKFCTEVRRELGLDLSWRILDDPTLPYAVAS